MKVFPLRRRAVVRGMAVVALATVAAVVAVAAAEATPSTAAKTGTKIRIAAVLQTFGNPYWLGMKIGTQDAARKYGVSVTFAASSSSTSEEDQASKLQAMTSQNYSCYLVAPITGTNLIQPLVTVSKRKVPIINLDNGIDMKAAKQAGVKLVTFIASNHYKLGFSGGQYLARILPKGSQVADIAGIPGTPISDNRRKGYLDALTRGGMKVVATAPANAQRAPAVTASADVLTAHPDVKGFVVNNDESALGVVQTLVNQGKAGKVKVVGIDGIKEALQDIQKGTMTATTSQYPYLEGYMGVESCLASLQHKKLPSYIATPFRLITKQNAAQALRSWPRPFGHYTDVVAARLRKK